MLEDYQIERLEFIESILPYFGDNFILKGGTALSLFYGLNRYSEDLDFDAKNNNMNFINRLRQHKDFKSWDIHIKKDTQMVFRASIDYKARSHLGDYPLKIEVSSRNKSFLQNGRLLYNKQDSVNVYDISELIKMKVVAFSGRDKIRDFYDLGFLLQKYPTKFSQEALFNIHEKISYSGIDELNMLLLSEVESNKLILRDNINDIKYYAQDMLRIIENLIRKKQ